MSASRLASAAALALAGVLAACDPNGSGRVDATFSPVQCPPGTTNDALEDYGWDAGYFATTRFYDVLILYVQQYRAERNESDSVGIRLELDDLVRAGQLVSDGIYYQPTAYPFVVAVGNTSTTAQVNLHLYDSCPRLPGYAALSGEVSFDTFRIRVDGEKTGQNEEVVGQVRTASLGYPEAPAPIGTLEASFDFFPPTRTLAEPK